MLKNMEILTVIHRRFFIDYFHGGDAQYKKGLCSHIYVFNLRVKSQFWS